jgi:hypothetical protein
MVWWSAARARVLVRREPLYPQDRLQSPTMPAVFFSLVRLSSTREDYAFPVFERLLRSGVCLPTFAAIAVFPSLPLTPCLI